MVAWVKWLPVVVCAHLSQVVVKWLPVASCHYQTLGCCLKLISTLKIIFTNSERPSMQHFLLFALPFKLILVGSSVAFRVLCSFAEMSDSVSLQPAALSATVQNLADDVKRFGQWPK